jgi:pseudomonalisin
MFKLLPIQIAEMTIKFPHAENLEQSMHFIYGSFLFVLSALFPMFVSGQPVVPTQKDRVVVQPDLRATTMLRGHVPEWAAAVNDRGSVADNTPLRLTFILARSPEVQASFEQLLSDQQNPNSDSYHQWLTPHQVGERYGPTQHDLDALMNWLGSQGLTVTETAPSRVFVDVAAPAGVVARALGTTFHSFDTGVDIRISAMTEPVIPAAFGAVVDTIAGLSEISAVAMGRGAAVLDGGQSGGIQARYTTSAGLHYVTPADFALMFNLKPTYSAGYTGSGQKIAIVGRSRVALTDISAFETKLGLTSNVPNTIIPPSGVDPGLSGGGDQLEATLDLERVIATAPKAQADLVVSKSTGGLDGIYIAAQYAVQTLLDPVMNLSFGGCEAFSGSAGVREWDALFSQAASEGIAVFVSAMDSGAAGCSTQFGYPQQYQFRSINAICSSSYATCVGGTELVDNSTPTQYWSAVNDSSLGSVLSYIPEGAWNEPSNSGFAAVAAGGGGASVYISKPSWQSGIGVPADGARDVPDVSFPSAAHDAYYGCYAAGNGDCSLGRFEFFYGTSAAAPAMAAVAALLNQKMGSAQGNINTLLYRLAASSPSVFHDSTILSSGVTDCSVDFPSMCNNSTPSPYGRSGAAGYVLTTGYDQATGLGSFDISAFLNAASSIPKSLLAGTELSLTGSASTISNLQTATFSAVLSSKVPGVPTGTVQLYANTSPIGPAVAVVAGRAVTAPIPFTAAGSYLITATYSGDSIFTSTTGPGVALTVTGLTAAVKTTVSSTTIPTGTTAFFNATVSALTGGNTPSGTVRFFMPGSTADRYVAIVPLSGGVATTPVTTFSTIGNFTLIAQYMGDANYSPVSSASMSVAVQKVGTTTQLTGFGGEVGIGGGEVFGSTTSGVVGTAAPAPTGTLQLYVNGVATGTPKTIPLTRQGTYTNIFASAENYAVTAVYSGDANWLPSKSNAISLSISKPTSYSFLAMASPSLSVTPGGAISETGGVSALLGYTGTVNLSCSVAYNGIGVSVSPPTCSFFVNSLSFDASSTVQPFRIDLNTVAPRFVKGGLIDSSALQKHGWGISGGAALCVLFLSFAPIRRQRCRLLQTLVALSWGLIVMSGCSGSGGTQDNHSLGTTSGSYTVTINSTNTVSGVPAATPVNIALNVN